MTGSKRNKIKKIVSPHQDPPSTAIDDDLLDDLLAQLDSQDQTVQAESAAVINEVADNQKVTTNTPSKHDSKTRFKLRKARKAAALGHAYTASDPEAEARLRKEAMDEEKDIERVCQEGNLQIHEVNPDGHCLYSAVADQLAHLGIIPASHANYATVRHTTSQFILAHPEDFIPFLAPTTEDASGSGTMTLEGLQQYCATIRNTAEWGGEPEITAMSRAYGVPIHVFQAGRPSVVVHNPANSHSIGDDKRVVRISYHRRMYGLGEHYNSLRSKNKLQKLSI